MILGAVTELLPYLAGEARIVGLDLGTKTIGLALSDVGRRIATPLETIRRTKFRADAARLLALAEEHGVGGFVLGLPLNMNGTEGPRAQATRAFAANLAKLTDLPIAFWDERLTTVAAERVLIEADRSRRRRAELIDKMAAAWMLQGALDRLQKVPARPLSGRTQTEIRRLVHLGEVRISRHGFRELAKDGILVDDVLAGIGEAALVEDYPDAVRGPSVLLLHRDPQGRPIHVVWGIQLHTVSPAVLVTAYRPDPRLWSDDFMRRKGHEAEND